MRDTANFQPYADALRGQPAYEREPMITAVRRANLLGTQILGGDTMHAFGSPDVKIQGGIVISAYAASVDTEGGAQRQLSLKVEDFPQPGVDTFNLDIEEGDRFVQISGIGTNMVDGAGRYGNKVRRPDVVTLSVTEKSDEKSDPGSISKARVHATFDKDGQLVGLEASENSRDPFVRLVGTFGDIEKKQDMGRNLKPGADELTIVDELATRLLGIGVDQLIGGFAIDTVSLLELAANQAFDIDREAVNIVEVVETSKGSKRIVEELDRLMVQSFGMDSNSDGLKRDERANRVTVTEEVKVLGTSEVKTIKTEVETDDFNKAREHTLRSEVSHEPSRQVARITRRLNNKRPQGLSISLKVYNPERTGQTIGTVSFDNQGRLSNIYMTTLGDLGDTKPRSTEHFNLRFQNGGVVSEIYTRDGSIVEGEPSFGVDQIVASLGLDPNNPYIDLGERGLDTLIRQFYVQATDPTRDTIGFRDLWKP